MKKLLFFLLFSSSAYAVHYEKVHESINEPWFTGPLIASAATIIPLGHANVEPYLFIIDNFANYNNHWKSVGQPDFWTISNQFPVWIGIAPWADIVFQPTLNWKHTDSQTHATIGDFIGQIEFQLYQSELPHKTWIPSIKFNITETFPTGKFKNLSIGKLETDQAGGGSYITALLLAIGRMEQVSLNHFLKWIINITYSIPTQVHVTGHHAYGGGFGTKGTVYPGKNLFVDLAFEYNLDRHWAVALDLVGTWQSSTRFSGAPGVTATGDPAVNSSEAFIEYRIAPAIEYNWSQNLGLIAGVYLSVAGKNTGQFVSGVIAFNYFR